jgi:hypothetical protein
MLEFYFRNGIQINGDSSLVTDIYIKIAWIKLRLWALFFTGNSNAFTHILFILIGTKIVCGCVYLQRRRKQEIWKEHNKIKMY